MSGRLPIYHKWWVTVVRLVSMTVNSLNKATIDGSPAALLYPFEPTNIQEILGRSISRKSFQVLMLTRFNKNKVKQ